MSTDNFIVNKEVTLVPTAKRHVIRINDMKAFKNEYKQTNTIRSRELITVQTNAISIFVNEDIPDFYEANADSYIKYYLTINGQDFEVVPINSQRNGIKIIKTAQTIVQSSTSLVIEESIKSAYLTIVIEPFTKYSSPRISNIKILIGKKAMI